MDTASHELLTASYTVQLLGWSPRICGNVRISEGIWSLGWKFSVEYVIWKRRCVSIRLDEVRRKVYFWVKSVDFEGNVIIGECEGTVRRGLLLNLSGGMNDAGGDWRSGRCI